MPTSALTGLTLQDLYDAGLHFGHQTKRWNPKMKSYIFNKQNGIHIIDLTQTLPMLDEAGEFLRKTILDGKKVLFVATKKQAQEAVKAAAEQADQPYVTERWLGGTLTNARTLRGSVKRMKTLQAISRANNGSLSAHKQEDSVLRRELRKLEKNLTGIADMDEKPGAIFIVDVVREGNAVLEALKLNIPIVAITDTNADPDPIDYVIPGNDDTSRGVELIVNALAKVISDAKAEYSAKVAEESARRDAERREREDKEKAERQARRERAAAEKATAADKAGKEGLKSARAKTNSAAIKQAVKAAKEAAEAKAKEELAAARQAKIAEAQAAVAAEAATETPAPAPEA